MKHAVLGVSGSVAAYRAADLARELMRHGYEVRVCLTDAAQHFVTPALFEALTGHPCVQGVFEEPQPGRMAHIDWARWADVLILAPATANTLAKLASGIGDDMLTTLALATHAPLVIAPAMNPAMYASDATQSALGVLRGRAAIVVEPNEGDVACGENGQGKLASIAKIVAATETVTARGTALAGKHVVITSGPTEEPIDLARILTNRSSGKMGAALARAALLMGARVTVISGPASAPLPLPASIIQIRTAQEMLDAGLTVVGTADIIIGAAAVADYRPANPYPGKLRRGPEPLTLELVPNPDVLAELVKAASPATISIGFAAEPSTDLDAAREKRIRKGLTALALNDVSRSDIGFGSEANELTLITENGTAESGRQGKLACALWLLDQIASISQER